jgi:methyl-accepting chemotaxis protein
MKRKEKRRLFPVVNSSLQYRFLAMILIYGFFIVAFLAVCLFLPDIIQLQDESLHFETRAAAADKILTLHARVWPAVIILILILGLHSFYALHRIIGPLCRFRWAFDKIGNGDFSFRVKIRKNDYLHLEEEALNKMIERLSEKLETLQRSSKKIQEASRELEKTLKPASQKGGAKRQAFQAFQDALCAFFQATSVFQVAGVTHPEVSQDFRRLQESLHECSETIAAEE